MQDGKLLSKQRIEQKLNSMYSDLIKDKKIYSLSIPATIVPSPTDMDYEKESIERYFTQKTNDIYGFVYEVDRDTYNELSKNPYWMTVSIRWRIVGPVDMVYDSEGKLKDKGVKESNKASITDGQQIIKNLNLYLPNILQFYK
jgi:hypothetical protein